MRITARGVRVMCDAAERLNLLEGGPRRTPCLPVIDELCGYGSRSD